MKISTKGRYGLRAMLDLAVYSKIDHVTLNSIAERQNISANYLEQVFSILRRAGLVKSIKGAQGGYILGNSPGRISVGQILRALEGELFQGGEDEAVKGQYNVEYCLKSAVWARMQANINDLADSITLEDLVAEYKRINKNQSYMFYI
ncbi:MAG: RrF2 family transcriptional regulator [Peptococcaceae bacterium]